MYLYTNKVIPIDTMLNGVWPDFALIKQNAKEHPGYFAWELFALFLVGLGAVTCAGWAYELGKQVGHLIG